ncbi:MAG: electron transfer flavoprotein subunit alpha/FixB family protein [Eubacteriales bacterium]|nr:electron transfer flavoprotein subunit alpha/FixB family protein [Eubacteriales bacterium]
MKNNDCFVVLSCRNGNLHPSAWELTGAARRLTKTTGGRVCGILLFEDTYDTSMFSGLPLDILYLCQTAALYDPQSCGDAIAQCVREYDPAVLLLPGTTFGRAIAPRVAVACRTGLTADCTELEWGEDGFLLQIRPAFGGDIMARIVTDHTRPQMATVRPGILPACEPCEGAMAEVVVRAQNSRSALSCMDIQPKATEKFKLSEQKIIVAAGRGVRSAEDLQSLQELADRLGGTLACSRALVEAGFLTHRHQIGLSGASIRADLLLTFGISGSVQFMAGARQAKKIIAVNSNPEARIFQFAHVPIVGDLYEIVPELLGQLDMEGDSLHGTAL